MRKVFLANMPDLVEIQKTSFCWFLEEGLGEELRNLSSLADFMETFEVRFFHNDFFENIKEEQNIFILSFILRLFDFIFCTSIDPLSLLNLEEVRLYLQLLMFDGLLLLTAMESYELPLSSALMSCFTACFGSPSYTNF